MLEADDTSSGQDHSESRHSAHRLVHRHEHPHWTVGRVAFLAFSIAEVFSAYDRLGEVQPIFLLPAALCALASFACVWFVQAIALGSRDWFSVVTSQLAGNAFNRITPGGGATGTALQANMLADAGFDVAHAATALTVQSVLSTASIVALPVFALPFILFGTQVPSGLLQAFWIRIPVFLLMAAIGTSLFVADAPLRGLARAVTWVRRKLHRDPGDGALAERLLEGRNRIRREIGPQWQLALGVSLARWLFEYGVLLLALCGLSAEPDPALVLLAFVVASVLGLLPFTPGGLGFVEAGLAATLAVAGISTGDALVATLV